MSTNKEIEALCAELATRYEYERILKAAQIVARNCEQNLAQFKQLLSDTQDALHKSDSTRPHQSNLTEVLPGRRYEKCPECKASIIDASVYTMCQSCRKKRLIHSDMILTRCTYCTPPTNRLVDTRFRKMCHFCEQDITHGKR